VFFFVLSVGGPNVSVAVKRSANSAAHDVVKRPALQSVIRDSCQVQYIMCTLSAIFVLSHYFLGVCICSLWCVSFVI